MSLARYGIRCDRHVALISWWYNQMQWYTMKLIVFSDKSIVKGQRLHMCPYSMKKLKFNAIGKIDNFQGCRDLSQLLSNQSNSTVFHVSNILIIKNKMDIFVMTSKYKIKHLKLVWYSFVMAMMDRHTVMDIRCDRQHYGHQMWQTNGKFTINLQLAPSCAIIFAI